MISHSLSIPANSTAANHENFGKKKFGHEFDNMFCRQKEDWRLPIFYRRISPRQSIFLVS